jgi:hypothetical protein
MIIELIGKTEYEGNCEIDTNEENVIVLDNKLYILTDDELKKFYNGDYFEDGENEVDIYISEAPFELDSYHVIIK